MLCRDRSIAHIRVGFKSPATISQAQETAQYDGTPGTLAARGRHDPCVVPRAVPIVEAMAALGVPTTRSLAVALTGEDVWREAGRLPGAVVPGPHQAVELAAQFGDHLVLGPLPLLRLGPLRRPLLAALAQQHRHLVGLQQPGQADSARKQATIQFQLITTKDGRPFFPAFTDAEELRKFAGQKPVQSVVLRFDDYVSLIQRTEKA